MQENVESVKRKIEVLTLVRDRIKKKRNYFVCVALEAIGEEDDGLSDAANFLKQQIERAFKRAVVAEGSTVGTWLHVVHGIPREEMCETRLREYRLAWIDSWIADLQKTVDEA